MNPMPSVTPAPIHDIAPPVPFFPYPLWMVVLAILGALGLLALLIWGGKLLFSKKQKLTPAEATLAALTLLRSRMESLSPHDFGVEVSTLLRRYVQEEHGLSATTQTSMEFLESIRNNAVFSKEEKVMLGGFLETADLLKFARAEAKKEETSSLLLQAEQLVRTRNQGIASQGRTA